MNTYISILRGINANGHREIIMADLKQVYISLGLGRVITYMKSGNVVFSSERTNNKILVGEIELAIVNSFGLEVSVQVIGLNDFRKIYQQNSFINLRHEDTSLLYVTFLEHEPDKVLLKNLKKEQQGADEFIFDGTSIYLFCPNGYGRTKLNNTFFEIRLKTKATTRNWKTVTRLVEMAGAIERRIKLNKNF